MQEFKYLKQKYLIYKIYNSNQIINQLKHVYVS